MYSFNAQIERSLIDKYDAILIPGNDLKIFQNYLDDLLAKSIVVDSTIIDIMQNEDEYLLVAEAKENFGETLILNLKCTKQQYLDYKKFKCQSAYIAASINSISKHDVIADIDTLSNDDAYINMGKEIILAGNCLDLVETPTIYFYGNNNS